MNYIPYRRKQIAELADWHPDFDMSGVSVSEPDKAAGSPKTGDKIARNPKNHADKWLVAADYFAENFEKVWEEPPPRKTPTLRESLQTNIDSRKKSIEDQEALLARLESLGILDQPADLLDNMYGF